MMKKIIILILVLIIAFLLYRRYNKSGNEQYYDACVLQLQNQGNSEDNAKMLCSQSMEIDN